jgi:hypothetical protein
MESKERKQDIDEERQAVIAEQLPFKELPGSMRKHIRVSPVESAVVLKDRHPVKVLGPGKHGVGWWFFGIANPHIHVARFYTRDFTIHLSLPAESGDAVRLEALLTAVVSIDDMAACCRSILGKQESLTIKDVDDELSAAQEIQSLVASGCSPYEGDLLIYDSQKNTANNSQTERAFEQNSKAKRSSPYGNLASGDTTRKSLRADKGSP